MRGGRFGWHQLAREVRDMDPGVDDALAIMLAANSPDIWLQRRS